jgi:hypothetical protein
MHMSIGLDNCIASVKTILYIKTPIQHTHKRTAIIYTQKAYGDALLSLRAELDRLGSKQLLYRHWPLSSHLGEAHKALLLGAFYARYCLTVTAHYAVLSLTRHNTLLHLHSVS